jgi:hypothetical protein
MTAHNVVIAAAPASLCAPTYRAYKVFFLRDLIMQSTVSPVFEQFSMLSCVCLSRHS